MQVLFCNSYTFKKIGGIMKLIKNAIFLFIIFFLSDCASTSITSFKDPDYKKADFKRILVVVNSSDLGNRLKLETKMAEEIRKVGIFAMESYQLFPPTREIGDEDKVKLLIDNNIDSFISISVGESGVDNVYIPPTSSITKTEGNVNVYGNQASYEEKSKTTYQGGYTLSKPWAEFNTKLYDVSNGRMVWIASSFTGGNAFADFNNVTNSYCQEIVKKLEIDRLIPSKRITGHDKLLGQKSIIYLKNHTIKKGHIMGISKLIDGITITEITIRDEEGNWMQIPNKDIDRIEEVP